MCNHAHTGIANALVLGGTGHIGNAIVRALLARGIPVTVSSRQTRPTPNLSGLTVRFVTTRTAGAGAAAAQVAGHDLVVDAAAPYPLRIFEQGRRCRRDSVRFAARRTDALIAAVRDAGARLAVVGSFTTLPRPAARMSGFEARLIARLHPYFDVKREIETAVIDGARGGARALVVNPTAVLGPWDCKDPALCFLPMTLNHRLPFSSPRVVNVIDVRDVATGLISAVLAGQFGKRIPLCGHNVRLSDLSARACAIGRVHSPRFPASTLFGAGVAVWGDYVWGLCGVDTPVPSLPILLTRYSYPMEAGAIQRQLGVVARPLASTLRDALQWYASIGYIRPAAAG